MSVVHISVHTDQYRYTRRYLLRKLDAAVTATEEYQSGAPVHTCLEIRYLPIVTAGAVEAVPVAMRTHAGSASVQEAVCSRVTVRFAGTTRRAARGMTLSQAR
jgi:hypothetical protein